MSKHTPGTWYAVGAWVEMEDDNVADICTCNPADIGQEHLGRSDEEIMANARLIAAAPDMLEALQELLGCFYHIEQNEKTLAAVKAAMRAVYIATGDEL